MEMLWLTVADAPAESVTATTKEYAPADVGVPLIDPPLDSDKPGGNDPDKTEQL